MIRLFASLFVAEVVTFYVMLLYHLAWDYFTN